MLLSRCGGNPQTAKQTNKAHKEATEAGRHDADMETAYTPRHTHTYTKKERPAGRQEVGRWATCHAVVDVVHDTKTPVWDRDGSLCGPSDAARPSSSRREGKVTCSHSQRCCAWPEAGLGWLSGDVQKAGRDEIKVACKPHQE
jgi:hypothetical protein